LLTIVRGTVPLALFGVTGFAVVLGRLAAPVLAAQAIAPVIFGYALETLGTGPVLYWSAAIGTLSLTSVCWLAYRLRRGRP
jgi:hypothetical protein